MIEKGKQRHYFHVRQELTKHPISKQIKIVILEYTSWIFHAMVDILGNQRKKY